MTNNQPSILTVTLNPALDLSAHVDAMVPGPKLRLTSPVYEPGGGGVNVARAIMELGGQAIAWVALGGASGAQHRALMEAQDLDVRVFDGPGDTRATWAIMDAEGQQFRLQLPGPDWTDAQGHAVLDEICELSQGLVVLSGSQPPGLGHRFAQDLAGRLGSDRLVVDTSGAALRHLIDCPDPEARPLLLRLDQAEAENVAGHALAELEDTRIFAQDLVAWGVAQNVCIARGAEGSVLAGPAGTWASSPPRVPVVSKIGAGDSFTGGFALALARGKSETEALLAGTAAAAAAVMTTGSALCRAADVNRILPDCVLTRLAP